MVLGMNEEGDEKHWMNIHAEAPTLPRQSLATQNEDDRRLKHGGAQGESPSVPRAEQEESYDITLKRAERERRSLGSTKTSSTGPSLSSSSTSHRSRRTSRKKSDDLSSDKGSKADHADIQKDIEQARAAVSRSNHRGRFRRSSESTADSGSQETRLTSLAAREKGVTGDNDTLDGRVGAYRVSGRAPGRQLQMPRFARPSIIEGQPLHRYPSGLTLSTGDALSALTPYSNYPSSRNVSSILGDDTVTNSVRSELSLVDASVSELIVPPAQPLMEEASDKRPGCMSEMQTKVLYIVLLVVCLGVAILVGMRQTEFRKGQTVKQDTNIPMTDDDITTIFKYCDQNGTFVLDSEVQRSTRYSQLKSQIDIQWDKDESALFDGTVCSPHDLALTWLADADAMELNVRSEGNGREIRQRLAMSLFCFSTNMPNLFLMNLWLTSESECLWLGVVCNELGFVTKIELSGFGIEGHIPNLLLPLLPSLEALDLSENKLTGHIPISLYSTLSIVTLHLESNSLSGKIDERSWTANSLEKIFLGANDFTGTIPTSLASLTNLNELVCDSNDLTGTLPDTIFNLPSLKIIHFGSNKLTGHLPEVMSTALVNINCAENMLNGTIPTRIYQLTNLYQLTLEKNALTGSLSSLVANLVNLELFELSSNHFTASLPTELSMLSRLHYLAIDDNKITGQLFSGIGRLTNLGSLNLERNFISGPLPSEMGSLTSLAHLLLSGNDLTGSIPESWGRLSNLQMLFLTGNSLSGSVPDNVCSDSSEFRVGPDVQCTCCS